MCAHRPSGDDPQSAGSAGLDGDLASLDRDALLEQVQRLRAGIRTHRDSSGHDLCWHHPELWGLLPERVRPAVAVPTWPQFLRGCVAYRASLDTELAGAARHEAEFDGRDAPDGGSRARSAPPGQADTVPG